MLIWSSEGHRVPRCKKKKSWWPRRTIHHPLVSFQQDMTAVVADFGLARIVNEQPASPRSPVSSASSPGSKPPVSPSVRPPPPKKRYNSLAVSWRVCAINTKTLVSMILILQWNWLEVSIQEIGKKFPSRTNQIAVKRNECLRCHVTVQN